MTSQVTRGNLLQLNEIGQSRIGVVMVVPKKGSYHSRMSVTSSGHRVAA
jgi:hypothetical protein